jgi:hypothetical protein
MIRADLACRVEPLAKRPKHCAGRRACARDPGGLDGNPETVAASDTAPPAAKAPAGSREGNPETVAGSSGRKVPVAEKGTLRRLRDHYAGCWAFDVLTLAAEKGTLKRLRGELGGLRHDRA